MIVTNRESWLHFVFAARGTTLSRIWRRLTVNVAFALVMTLGHMAYGWLDGRDVTPLPFTLIGFVLGIFLGFRINTAYDRYWEGRRLWGQLVNTCRTLARQIQTLVGAGLGDAALAERRRRLVYLVMAFPHALRMRLRGEEAMVGDLAAFVTPTELEQLRGERNRPNALVQRMAEQLDEAYRAELIHPMHLSLLHQSLTALTDIQGGCERIANTPIPFAYQVLLRRIVGAYCYALPFGVLSPLGLMTPVVVLMMSYAFYGLDALGDEIQDPFGSDPNDLPLSALCRTIEIDLRQRLGEAELPEPAQPHHGQLL
ncbi:bestrophin family ion channel [Nannocystis sp. SCPEA4]|uniref:bestrophin family protein n=1 Tax=Nannocystis sp. SCPEA4 TaxID=2996787 RepID=UPI00226EE7C7|nr:bestrophin family ion channel [Nannocystis sp. SCPEA4]MCY1057926.1 bestrophin family ion channel [Nannocystis sp. SCPEA4]